VTVFRNGVTQVGITPTTILNTQYPGWILLNNGSNTVYLGDGAVTVANGWPVAAGAVFTPDEYHWRTLTGQLVQRLSGIVAAGTEEVRVFNPGRVSTE